jgi:hypothetical protein
MGVLEPSYFDGHYIFFLEQTGVLHTHRPHFPTSRGKFQALAKFTHACVKITLNPV